MYEIGDIVVHKNGVCRIKDIAEKYRKDEDYYVLETLGEEPLTIRVPKSKSKKLFRPILTKAEAEELIDLISGVDAVQVDSRMPEHTYKALIEKGTHEALVCIIKTAYSRSRKRENRGLKVAEKDKMYFRMAEKMLYGELSVVLNMTLDETRDYVVDRVGHAVQQS